MDPPQPRVIQPSLPSRCAPSKLTTFSPFSFSTPRYPKAMSFSPSGLGLVTAYHDPLGQFGTQKVGTTCSQSLSNTLLGEVSASAERRPSASASTGSNPVLSFSSALSRIQYACAGLEGGR